MNNSGSTSPTRLPHLTLLLAFKSVAETRSFTQAANSLHLSQSAVSQQISKLEEALGVQLFIRSTRSVSLTDAGVQLLNEIRSPFDQLVLAFDRCARRSETPELHIESEPVLSAFWLTPRLKQFTQRFPSIRLQQILTTQRVEFPEDIELAIKWGTGDWPGYHVEYLLGLKYVPVCSPAVINGNPPLREVGDLAHQTLLHDRNQDDWKTWSELHPTIPIKLDGGHVVTDSNVLAQLAIEGHGVALCGQALIERPLREGDLVIPFPDLEMRHEKAYYLLTKKNKALSSVAAQFVEWIKQEAARYEAD